VFPETKRSRSRRAPGGAVERKAKTTMKEKPNYAELEKQIDFTALAGKLSQLSEHDNPQRKTVFSLLTGNGSVLDFDMSSRCGTHLGTMARKLRVEYPGAVVLAGSEKRTGAGT